MNSMKFAPLIALALASPGVAAHYGLTVLQPLPGYTRGAVGDTSFGLNNAGQSVSRSIDAAGGLATRWDNAGNPTALAAPADSWFSKADDINNHGVMVGDIHVLDADGNDIVRATRWVTPASYEYFLGDNGYASFADQVNDNGWVTGIRYAAASDLGDPEHFEAFVWSPDGTTRWVTPLNSGFNLEFKGINASNSAVGQELFPDDPSVSGAAYWTEAGGTVWLPDRSLYYTEATDINDAGFIVGTDYDGDITDAPLWWDPAHNLHVLPALAGMSSSIPTRLNALNQVVGWSLTEGCDYEDRLCRTATLWTLDGSVVDLNTLIDPALGDRLLWANAINDVGQIYGEAVHADGSRFVFLLTPGVPEPSSWAMMIAGFGIVGAAARRRTTGATA